MTSSCGGRGWSGGAVQIGVATAIEIGIERRTLIAHVLYRDRKPIRGISINKILSEYSLWEAQCDTGAGAYPEVHGLPRTNPGATSI